ncbi:MAG TPA: choice-of-anchor D domain-containing protein [Candidatus Binataceae bacterium]|nr:choice-of-anchor D domain-containing protein [Candidatus Binataceae bacterium]
MVLLTSMMIAARSSTGSNGVGANPATRVLGQVNLTNTAPNFTDPSGLFAPTGVAIDRSVTPNRIYVADQNNSRILGWNDASSFTDGAPANLVIGQPDFNSSLWNQNGGAPNANTLWFPTAVAVDGSGNLYVLDDGNNRVLEYDSPFTTDTTADRVFGQPDFSSNLCNQGLTEPTPETLCLPYVGNVNTGGLAVDNAGNLYVTDARNNRVLEYDNPLAPGGGTPGTPGAAGDTTADLIFGSNVFNQVTPASPTTLNNPTSVAVDASSNVYIADWGNNRTLEYYDPLAAGGGTPGAPGSPGDTTADVVLGQPNLNTGGCSELPPNYPSNELCYPTGVTVDSGGNVYVSDDYLGQRVLEFNAPISTNQNANLIIPAVQFPAQLAVDSSDNLYLASADAGYVEEFDQPVTTQVVTPNRTLGLGGINGVKPSGVRVPGGIAIDSSVSPNRIFASDLNQRILGWKNASSFANGAPADLSFNPQPQNFYPNRIAVDPQGNLYISGAIVTPPNPSQSELLEYNTPFNAPPSAPNLDLGSILGMGVAIDAAGNVWAGNGTEVTEWDNPMAPGGGTPGTPGSPGDTTPDLTIDMSNYGQVQGLAVDSEGNLWVAADSVVEFDNPLAPGGGTPGTPGSPGDTTADWVLSPAQSPPACGGNTVTANCFSALDVAVDDAGTLYVVDNINNRILGYQNPLLQNPANIAPQFVFGQDGSFTSGFCNSPGGIGYFNIWFGASATTLCNPLSIALDPAGELFATDSNNNRLLQYEPPFGAGPTIIPTATATASVAATPTTVATPNLTPVATPTGTAIATATFTATPTATPTPIAGRITLTPKTLTFALQKLGFDSTTESGPQNLKLINNLKLPVQIVSIVASPGDFTETDGCGHVLAPHLSCPIEVHFSPTTIGPHVGTLTVYDNATNSPQVAQLSGQATSATLTISKKTLSFGKQTLLTTSLGQSVKLLNQTSVDVSFEVPVASAGYQVTNLCGAQYVAAQSSCNLEVKFVPIKSGSNPGTLTIIDGAKNAKVIVHLRGTGVAP